MVLTIKARTRRQVARFWGQVDKSGDCWLWTGCKNINGYGVATYGVGSVMAHRLSYQLAFGQFSRGLHVHHTCENRACVRPSHLRLMTQRMHRQLHPLKPSFRRRGGRRPIPAALRKSRTIASCYTTPEWNLFRRIAKRDGVPISQLQRALVLAALARGAEKVSSAQ